MAICDITIKKDIAPSCDDPIVPGLEQEGVIMNRADVDFGAVTFNATRKNVIETLALKTGKKGYKLGDVYKRQVQPPLLVPIQPWQQEPIVTRLLT